MNRDRAVAQTSGAFSQAIRALRLLVALSGLSVAVLLGYRGIENALSAMDHAPGLFVDFHIYLDQARRLSQHPVTLNPAWVYPPLLAWVLSAFSRLPDRIADTVWLIGELFCIAGLSGLCAQLLSPLRAFERWCVACGLTLASLPVLHCLKWGQVSILILLLALAGLRRRSVLGHLLLGVATALKAYPLVYALVYLLRKDGRSFFLVSGVALLLGGVLPLLILGPETLVLFFARSVANTVRLISFVGVESQSWAALVERWFDHGGDPGGNQPALFFALPWVVRGVLNYAGAATLLGTTWWLARRQPVGDLACLSAYVLALTIVMRPGWFHYFVVLPVAQAALLSRVRALDTCFACLALSVGLGLLATFGYFLDAGFFFVTRNYGLVTLSAIACLVGQWQTADADLGEPR